VCSNFLVGSGGVFLYDGLSKLRGGRIMLKKILMIVLIPIGLAKRILQIIGVIDYPMSDEQRESLENWGEEDD